MEKYTVAKNKPVGVLSERWNIITINIFDCIALYLKNIFLGSVEKKYGYLSFLDKKSLYKKRYL